MLMQRTRRLQERPTTPRSSSEERSSILPDLNEFAVETTDASLRSVRVPITFFLDMYKYFWRMDERLYRITSVALRYRTNIQGIRKRRVIVGNGELKAFMMELCHIKSYHQSCIDIVSFAALVDSVQEALKYISLQTLSLVYGRNHAFDLGDFTLFKIGIPF